MCVWTRICQFGILLQDLLILLVLKVGIGTHFSQLSADITWCVLVHLYLHHWLPTRISRCIARAVFPDGFGPSAGRTVPWHTITFVTSFPHASFHRHMQQIWQGGLYSSSWQWVPQDLLNCQNAIHHSHCLHHYCNKLECDRIWKKRKLSFAIHSTSTTLELTFVQVWAQLYLRFWR